METSARHAERVQAALGRFRPESSRLRRRIITPTVVALCKFYMQKLNQVEMHNLQAFEAARALNRPLLTFSNHTSLFDDPWLVATFSGSDHDRLRWCATDALNFFDSPLMGWFFSAGKGVPIVRGAGIEQPGMVFLRDRLLDGDWVHIFPEGGRSREPGTIRPLKTGLAHLVKLTRPLLQPFYHQGMEAILPIGSHVPRIGKRVELRFGEVLDSDRGLADEGSEAITAWAQQQLLELQQACSYASGVQKTVAGRQSPA